MKITCLSENTTVSDKFQSEHGLSLYIETKTKKVLFDMGQTDAFWKNAELLDIDLRQVDLAILSHGHYDHSGGMKTFLTCNPTAKVYVSKYAFGEHYNSAGKYIGVDKTLMNSHRLIFCGDSCEICEDLTLFSKNDAPLTVPIDSAGLTAKNGTEFLPDTFAHEQYLKISENGKTFLISGCSHKGIVNIESWFQPDVLIGGFHFMKQPADTNNPVLRQAAEQLMCHSTVYYTGHCTGTEQYAVLKQIMNDRLHYLAAGQTVEF